MNSTTNSTKGATDMETTVTDMNTTTKSTLTQTQKEQFIKYFGDPFKNSEVLVCCDFDTDFDFDYLQHSAYFEWLDLLSDCGWLVWKSIIEISPKTKDEHYTSREVEVNVFTDSLDESIADIVTGDNDNVVFDPENEKIDFVFFSYEAFNPDFIVSYFDDLEDSVKKDNDTKYSIVATSSGMLDDYYYLSKFNHPKYYGDTDYDIHCVPTIDNIPYEIDNEDEIKFPQYREWYEKNEKEDVEDQWLAYVELKDCANFRFLNIYTTRLDVFDLISEIKEECEDFDVTQIEKIRWTSQLNPPAYIVSDPDKIKVNTKLGIIDNFLMP